MAGEIMEARNALIVGGQKRCWETVLSYLKDCGIQIYDHWTDEKYLDSKLPRSVDIVIIISSQVAHALEKHAIHEAGKHGKIYVRTDHRWSKFPEQLKKWGIQPLLPGNVPTLQREAPPERDTPLVPIESVAASTPAPQPQNPQSSPESRILTESPKREEFQMPKSDQKLQKHQVRAQAKIKLLHEILAANPFENPDSINRKIAEKYPGKHPSKPGGVSKALIAQIRMDEHGIKIGPGGRPTNKRGERIEIPEKYLKVVEKERSPVKLSKPTEEVVQEAFVEPSRPAKFRAPRQPAADESQSADRLRQLMSQIRNVMETEGIDQLNIPLQGQVQVRRFQTMDI